MKDKDSIWAGEVGPLMHLDSEALLKRGEIVIIDEPQLEPTDAEFTITHIDPKEGIIWLSQPQQQKK